MRFMLGVAVGAFFARPIMTVVDRHFGHLLVPAMLNVADRLTNLADNRENSK